MGSVRRKLLLWALILGSALLLGSITVAQRRKTVGSSQRSAVATHSTGSDGHLHPHEYRLFQAPRKEETEHATQEHHAQHGASLKTSAQFHALIPVSVDSLRCCGAPTDLVDSLQASSRVASVSLIFPEFFPSNGDCSKNHVGESDGTKQSGAPSWCHFSSIEGIAVAVSEARSALQYIKRLRESAEAESRSEVNRRVPLRFIVPESVPSTTTKTLLFMKALDKAVHDVTAMNSSSINEKFIVLDPNVKAATSVSDLLGSMNDALVPNTTSESTDTPRIIGCGVVDASEVVSYGLAPRLDGDGNVFIGHQFSGYPRRDPRIQTERVLELGSVSGMCMTFTMSLWKDVGGFSGGVSASPKPTTRSQDDPAATAAEQMKLPREAAVFLRAGAWYKTAAADGEEAIVQLDPVIRSLPYTKQDAQLFDSLRSAVVNALNELSAYEHWMNGRRVSSEFSVSLPGIGQRCKDPVIVNRLKGLLLTGLVEHDSILYGADKAPESVLITAAERSEHRARYDSMSMRIGTIQKGHSDAKADANALRAFFRSLHILPKQSFIDGVNETLYEGKNPVIRRRQRELREKQHGLVKDVLLEASGILHNVVARRQALIQAHRQLLSTCGSEEEPFTSFALRARETSGASVSMIPAQVELVNDVVLKNFTFSFSVAGSAHLARFESKFRDAILAKRHISRNVVVTWTGMCCNCCGFSNEIAQIIAPLSDIVTVRTTLPTACHCPGIPFAVKDSIEHMMTHRGARVDVGASSGPSITSNDTLKTRAMTTNASDDVNIWVYHVDPVTSHQLWWKEAPPSYAVLRCMTEFDRVPPSWARVATKVDPYDEVWVPSRHGRDALIRSGFPAEMIRLVPEGLDVSFFDPSVVDTIALPSDLSRPRWRSYDSTGGGQRYVERMKDNFKFLSVFKWEPRKGWEFLLEGYFFAFTSKDPVSLIIHTYLFEPKSGWDPRDPRLVFSLIGDHVRKMFASPRGRKLWQEERGLRNVGEVTLQLPHFEIITEHISEKDMLQLYKSVDAFVLPSRGEGWGLPIVQAMAMELPTVTTNYSGMRDFADMGSSSWDEMVALLIPANEVPVPANSTNYKLAPGARWAQPDSVALSSILKSVFARRGTEELKQLGKRARKHIVDNFSTDAITKRIAERLREIEEIVVKRRAEARGG